MSRLVSRPEMTRLLKLSHPNLTYMKHGQNHWTFLQNQVVAGFQVGLADWTSSELQA